MKKKGTKTIAALALAALVALLAAGCGDDFYNMTSRTASAGYDTFTLNMEGLQAFVNQSVQVTSADALTVATVGVTAGSARNRVDKDGKITVTVMIPEQYGGQFYLGDMLFEARSWVNAEIDLYTGEELTAGEWEDIVDITAAGEEFGAVVYDGAVVNFRL